MMRKQNVCGRLYLSGMGGDSLPLARQYGLGLEVTEFCVAANLEDPARCQAAETQCGGISQLWLHAPFAELCPCAIDPLVRAITEKRYLQTIDMARKLHINRIVIHGGFIPLVYFPEWYVEQSVAFWRSFMTKVPADMIIALENVMEPGPEMLVEIVRQVDDKRLGLCLDVGHAHTSISRTPSLAWVEAMAPWLYHVHLHNNEGDWDLHAPLGEGSIPMEQVLSTVLRLCPHATFTLENRSCQPSLIWLREQGFWQDERQENGNK